MEVVLGCRFPCGNLLPAVAHPLILIPQHRASFMLVFPCILEMIGEPTSRIDSHGLWKILLRISRWLRFNFRGSRARAPQYQMILSIFQQTQRSCKVLEGWDRGFWAGKVQRPSDRSSLLISKIS